MASLRARLTAVVVLVAAVALVAAAAITYAAQRSYQYGQVDQRVEAAKPLVERQLLGGDEDGDVEMPADSSTEVSKRAKTDSAPLPTGVSNPSSDEAMLAHAKRTAAYIPILSPEILLPPKLPTREEMEAYLLELRKKALVEEYFGDEQ